jgi:hypothetical protein
MKNMICSSKKAQQTLNIKFELCYDNLMQHKLSKSKAKEEALKVSRKKATLTVQEILNS